MVHTFRSTTTFDRFMTAIATLGTTVADDFQDALDELIAHGRDAALPHVRHSIQPSRYRPDMAEIRSATTVKTTTYVLRGLVYFDDRTNQITPVIVGLVAGNKAGFAPNDRGDWYDNAVPVADDIIDTYLTTGELP